MEHNTNRILWTVLILAISVALYIGFRPAVNGLLSQTTEKIQTVVDGIHGDTNDSPSNNSNSSSSTVVGTNLLTGTNNVLTTVPNATGWSTGLPMYRPAEALHANQTYTVSCYLEPAKHDANICMNYPNGNMYGTIIPAGSKGLSTLTINLTPEEAKEPRYFWITFTSHQTDNSAVSYKGFKLEKGSVATPWCPNPADQAQ